MVKAGGAVAFTIDGPRGPRYVAKKGPVMLARHDWHPITPFYVAVEKAWVLNTWDAMLIPKPFSRIHVRVAKNIFVPPMPTTRRWSAITPRCRLRWSASPRLRKRSFLHAVIDTPSSRLSTVNLILNQSG